ncbi:hypothetical protein JCM19232_3836 [Vibrio ishigakensis]|uniref:Uncharacterized protein n=1 Tax=Vibrio ishigakensis TaxID=1481914 RepID=A0A0B8PDK2_9VIBR|nr:hypothetical protein JCM19232_3836 [Vibrio ishigakensis]
MPLVNLILPCFELLHCTVSATLATKATNNTRQFLIGGCYEKSVTYLYRGAVGGLWSLR